MIGTTVVLGDGTVTLKNVSTLKEPWHKHEQVLACDSINVSYINYNGYPISIWEYNNTVIVIEGAIYNIDDEIIKSKIDKIIDNGVQNSDVLEFVNCADGDYCIFIVNKGSKKIVVFNDILGGLPLFYYNDGKTIYVSRQYGIIASNISDNDWSSENIAEYLSFGYNLRTRTFSNKIQKFEPASLLRAQSCGSLSCQYYNLYVDDFTVSKKYNSKEDAAKDLARLFEESCKRRVEYAAKHGYTIVNTMSGGFDSRTIAGGLEKFSDDYINITYQYLQDESTVAKSVLAAIDSKSKYIKLSFQNQPDLFNRRLTLNTDGRINAYTNSICYHDMLSVRSHFGNERILYFGGFGGEFIRHPRFETLMPFNKLGLTYSPTYYLTSRICNTDVKHLISVFSESFKNVTNIGECRYKDFYNEYYQNLVRCSGEDRTRMFYFTVQPMMGKDFIMAIRHKVPLKWVGFEFYKKFLREIDERLVSVGVFGHDDSYLEDNNLRKIDFKRRVLEYYLSPIRYVYKRICNTELKKNENSVSYEDLSEYLNELKNKSLFNNQFISENYSKFSNTLLYRLISVLSYISSLENA